MSHVEKCKATLGIVNKSLLEATLKVVSESFGVVLSQSIDSKYRGKNLTSFDGNTFLASIRTKNCPEGVGIMLTSKGELEFAHDYDGHRAAQKEIMDAIDHNFKVLALGIVLQKVGFPVKIIQSIGEQQLHIHAER